jgi:competence protein ComEA
MLKKILALLAMLYFAAAAFAAVDVNKASPAELDGVKGIGPATSKTIVDERKKGGDFKSWDDFIARTKGIGETKAANLSREGLTVNGQSYKPAGAKEEKKAAKKEEKPAAKQAKKEEQAAPAKPAASAKK